MADFTDLPLLNDPPLVEVLYSLQAVTSPTILRDHVRPLVDEVLAGYSEIQDMNKVQIRVQAQDGKQVQEQDMDWGGCKAISEDRTEVVHLMREGLFVNFLPPYKGFPECIAIVKKHWDLYQQCFKPDQVVRIGIRYINVLRIPMVDGAINFGEFFKLQTFYPFDGPFQLHRFHHQFEVSEPEFGIPARLSFTSTKESKNELEVVLDIEAFEEGTWQPMQADVWPRFDRARLWAYKLFRNTLTEQCFQQYQ